MPWDEPSDNKQTKDEWQWWPSSESQSEQSLVRKKRSQYTSFEEDERRSQQHQSPPQQREPRQRKPRMPRQPVRQSAAQYDLYGTPPLSSYNDDDDNDEEASRYDESDGYGKNKRSPSARSRKTSRQEVVMDIDEDEVEGYVQSAMNAAKMITTEVDEGSRGGNTRDNSPREAETVEKKSSPKSPPPPPKRQLSPKIGILLIDHGSKRKASNDHLHSVADQYESLLNNNSDDETPTPSSTSATTATIVVRAAHMELAQPSILSSLRSLICNEGVTKVICVPYFLSPGKHATVDVPNLIADARVELEEEGLLDYIVANTSSKEDGEEMNKNDAKVEIVMSKSLGSNVDSMLGVVDSLVEIALEDDGSDGRRQDFEWNGLAKRVQNELANVKAELNEAQDSRNELEATSKADIASLKEETRKFTNRAILLEDMLEKKVQQLRTMTNRVTLLEDVLVRVQSKKKGASSRSSSVAAVNGNDTSEDEDEASDKLANLTATVETLLQEKEDIERNSQSLMMQVTAIESDYNATIEKLTCKISSLEEELKLQSEINDILQKKAAEQSSQKHLEEQHQQDKIIELESQLADLLDAYNELEQLQNETETVVLRYQRQIKESREEYESLIASEKERVEEYRLKWNESQSLLEEETMRSRQLLNETKNEYEELLKEKKAVSDAWKLKWETSVAEQSSTKPGEVVADARAEEDWFKLQQDLEEAMSAKATATLKIQELEAQLQNQQQQQGSSDSKSKEIEQQKQLQKYMQSQLQSYYETIQEQSAQLDVYQQQIEDIEQKHEESMLIATNSVEASQRRENDLLTNIEELESELTRVMKEKDDREQWLNDLQDRLDIIERERDNGLGNAESAMRDVNDSLSVQESLIQENKQLAMEVERLLSEIRAVTKEKDRIWMEKTKVDMLMKQDGNVATSKDLPDVANVAVVGSDNKEQPKRMSRWRKLLRPWSLFRRIE
ncbi:predicted protein [Thalassiosira pseudonana CCMP1335]|uniref:Uncharacterized protein n=1 Tax=Thalassiosira pseudonana TaxID=35128 RepID=B8CB20_THAPS|nr:predicted protein [Thalassiosira pseudonana CCMP1335]EED89052.1 predicted protein [Thalassiosira pseudonana CCMP1335]